ncbi:MAG TPA: hypothetical protein VF753_19580 [Terriglobales bacterium]
MKSTLRTPWLVPSVALVLAIALQPLQAADKTQEASNAAQPAIALAQTYCGSATPCVLSHHNDNNRDGVNPNESILKASTLSSSTHPIPQWMASVDGEIYAQPLYVHQLSVNKSAKNAIFVATENNSVYSLDSDSTSSTGTVLAQINLNNASDLGSGYTEIAVPYTDLPQQCSTIVPEVGITGTPVIDVSVTPPVIYLVTKHEDVSGSGTKTYRQKLHGLYADTLQEIPGSPVILDTAFATANAPNFNPWANGQRAGLALVKENGGFSKIWVSWGSHCDINPYHGIAIEFGYNYNKNVFDSHYTTFDGESACTASICRAGIWMGGGAPAVDTSNNVYLSTGNGADQDQGSGEYTNSVIRLSDAGMQDYYSPPDYNALDFGQSLIACTNPNPNSCSSPCKWDSTHQYCQWHILRDDWDLASGGVILLQPTFTTTNLQMIASGKEGMVYNLFAKSMGHIDAANGESSEYACTTGTAPAAGTIVQCFLGFNMSADSDNSQGSWGTPAFLAGNNGTSNFNYLYTAGNRDVLNAFKLTNQSGVGIFSTTGVTPQSPHTFGYPGATPSITWNKATSDRDDAIVWTLETAPIGKINHAATAATLYAYKALPTAGSLGKELWDTSAYNKTSPGNPGAVKLVVPTVVDGKIFLAGGAQGYEPGSSNCPVPTTTVQPTACGALTMFK